VRFFPRHITGYDPGEQPRLGFSYAVVDPGIGWQTFSIGLSSLGRGSSLWARGTTPCWTLDGSLAKAAGNRAIIAALSVVHRQRSDPFPTFAQAARNRGSCGNTSRVTAARTSAGRGQGATIGSSRLTFEPGSVIQGLHFSRRTGQHDAGAADGYPPHSFGPSSRDFDPGGRHAQSVSRRR